jgi:hypothetical protein
VLLPSPHEEGSTKMLRSVVSKVMWVGRATVFVVGLAVILGLVGGLVSTALAANGQNFIIGNGLSDTVKNIATLPTKLTMQGTASGPALQVTQQSTNSGASGLGVTVPSGKVPITVNSTAGKATNLNADKLDGQDSPTFATKSGFGVTVIPSGGASLGGPLPLERTFTSKGGTTTIEVTGTAYRSSAVANGAGRIGMTVKVDGLDLDNTAMLTNELNSHKTLPTAVGVIKNLPAGTHTLRIEPMYDPVCDTANDTVTDYCTSTDNDYFRALVEEIPAS